VSAREDSQGDGENGEREKEERAREEDFTGRREGGRRDFSGLLRPRDWDWRGGVDLPLKSDLAMPELDREALLVDRFESTSSVHLDARPEHRMRQPPNLFSPLPRLPVGLLSNLLSLSPRSPVSL
jgi:hypothetical protein